jgi:hypothetical protein
MVIKLSNVGSFSLSCDLTTMCVFSVTAVARLDTPAGVDWSGYNCRVVHSSGLQHRCDEHSSTCKAAVILYTEGSLNIVAGNGGGGRLPPQYFFFLRIVQSVSVNVCIGGGLCACVYV